MREAANRLTARSGTFKLEFMPGRIFRRRMDLSMSAVRMKLRDLEIAREIETIEDGDGRVEILSIGWDRLALAGGPTPELLKHFWDRFRIERLGGEMGCACRVLYFSPKNLGLHVLFTFIGLSELFLSQSYDIRRMVLVLVFLNLIPLISALFALEGVKKSLLITAN